LMTDSSGKILNSVSSWLSHKWLVLKCENELKARSLFQVYAIYIYTLPAFSKISLKNTTK
jgi:hypothetical protein